MYNVGLAGQTHHEWQRGPRQRIRGFLNYKKEYGTGLGLHITPYIVLRIGNCLLTPLVPGDRDVERERVSSLPIIIVRAKETFRDLIQGEVFYRAVVQVSLGHWSRCKM